MSILQYKGNPYEQYEKELELANPSAKLPEFTYKILKQEEQLFSGKLLDAQNRLEAAKMQEITPSLAKTTPQAKKELEKNVKFFMEKLDRVRRELSFFQENKQVAA
jgi:hypothetical protein